MWDRFAFSVAIRQLRFNIAQTLLTVGVVSMSVILIIFITSLIGGLQKQLIKTITGSIPNITISVSERTPIAAWQVPSLKTPGTVYIGTREKLSQRQNTIPDWQEWVNRIQKADNRIIAVSPVVEGQGIAASGGTQKAVVATGVIPELHNRVVNIEDELQSGRFFGMKTGEVVIGNMLADDLSVKLGDRMRITMSNGTSDTYRIVGIFKTGFPNVDEGVAFFTLKDVQSLTGIQNAVTSIDIKLSDIFAANDVAAGLRLQVPYKVDSWMEEYTQLLTALRSQNQTSTLIILFVTSASALGIASILITVVTNKQREIGILRAIGAMRRQIIGLFTLQSTLMAALGGLVGVALGIGISIGAYRYRLSITPMDRTDEVFPILLSPRIVIQAFVIAIVIGFVASLYPAWRAAKVNPIEVIRGQ